VAAAISSPVAAASACLNFLIVSPGAGWGGATQR
jgi:hypothetical protein